MFLAEGQMVFTGGNNCFELNFLINKTFLYMDSRSTYMAPLNLTLNLHKILKAFLKFHILTRMREYSRPYVHELLDNIAICLC